MEILCIVLMHQATRDTVITEMDAKQEAWAFEEIPCN